MKQLRTFGFLIWLALAVVFGQQAALLHGLGHASEKLSQKQDSKPVPAKCDECFTCAQLAGGAPATAPTVPTVTCGIDGVTHVQQVAIAAALLAYRSQAPPVLL